MPDVAGATSTSAAAEAFFPSDEAAEISRLEGELGTVLDKYKHKRRELRSRQEELAALAGGDRLEGGCADGQVV